MKKLILLYCLLFSLALTAKAGTTTISQNKTILVDTDPTIKKTVFKKNYKESYTSKEFNYTQKAQEEDLWDRFVNWLSKWFERTFGKIGDNTSKESVYMILKIIAGIIVLSVIYLITKSVLNKEGNWIFGRVADKKVIHHEDIEKNLKNIDFKKLLNETIANGDLRLAVRYYYLWTLKEMSNKQIIEWNPEKTNSDYLYEIKSEKLKTEFEYLSYLYNYVWYGEFEMDEVHFEEVKKSFDKTFGLI